VAVVVRVWVLVTDHVAVAVALLVAVRDKVELTVPVAVGDTVGVEVVVPVRDNVEVMVAVAVGDPLISGEVVTDGDRDTEAVLDSVPGLGDSVAVVEGVTGLGDAVPDSVMVMEGAGVSDGLTVGKSRRNAGPAVAAGATGKGVGHGRRTGARGAVASSRVIAAAPVLSAHWCCTGLLRRSSNPALGCALLPSAAGAASAKAGSAATIAARAPASMTTRARRASTLALAPVGVRWQ
jgi:hypothetical protein